MKQRSERLAKTALGVFISALRRQIADTGDVMAEYAARHSQEEIETSADYTALIAAHYGAIMLLRGLTPSTTIENPQ